MIETFNITAEARSQKADIGIPAWKMPKEKRSALLFWVELAHRQAFTERNRESVRGQSQCDNEEFSDPHPVLRSPIKRVTLFSIKLNYYMAYSVRATGCRIKGRG